MLPRLRAEESIHAANIVGVGSGMIKRKDRRKLLRNWNRQIGVSSQLKLGKPGSIQMETTLASAGIKVVVVPAGPKGSPENSDD